MNAKRHLALLLLAGAAFTCAEPRPIQRSGAEPHSAITRADSAGRTQLAGGSTSVPSMPAVVAPTRRNRRRSGAKVPLSAGEAGPKVFDRLVPTTYTQDGKIQSPATELFRFPARAGVFSFCLSGSKPAIDPLFFQVLLGRDGKLFRLDGVQGAAAEETDFSVCAAMAQDEEAAPLKAGEIITVESTWDTRGPVTLTLSIEAAPP